jgi:dissimilatory sulfite reductase (desulfoviridin) alpha/beta subunit
LKDDDRYAVWVKTACGHLEAGQLATLADITERYGRGFLLFSSRQIPIIPFIASADVAAVQSELERVYLTLDRCGPTVRNVNVCPGLASCGDALADPLPLARRLDTFFHASMSHKVKLGVSGCPEDCIYARVLTDIGFVVTSGEDGGRYRAFVGARLGLNPFIGLGLVENLTGDECLRLTQNYFQLMNREGRRGERAADLIARLGENVVRTALTSGLDQPHGLEPAPCVAASVAPKAGSGVLRLKAVAGEVIAPLLRTIATIAAGYGRGLVYFPVRGGPEIPGISAEDMAAAEQTAIDAGLEVIDKAEANMQSCFGGYCTESLADPQSLLGRIDRPGRSGSGLTISASGCPNSCGVSHLADLGFYGTMDFDYNADACTNCGLCVPVCKRRAITQAGDNIVIDRESCRQCGQCVAVCPFDALTETRRGFAVLAGGRGGWDTRLGRIIADCVTEDEAVRITDNARALVAREQTDVASVIDRYGFEDVRRRLLEGALEKGV